MRYAGDLSSPFDSSPQQIILGVIIWRVLAVKVVVVSLRGGLLHLVLGAGVVCGQELVHRVVRGVFVLGVGNDIAVLELVVIVIVIAIDRRPRGLLRRLQLDEGVLWRVFTVEVAVV